MSEDEDVTENSVDNFEKEDFRLLLETNDRLAEAQRTLLEADDRAMEAYAVAVAESTKNVHLDAEEENALLKEIKQEVIQHLRDNNEIEPKHYRFNSATSSITDTNDSSRSSEFNGIGSRTAALLNSSLQALNGQELTEEQIRIQEALVKMRKLDRILLRTTQREREVKRERINIHKILTDELKELEKASISKEIKTNASKFLCLEPPPRHNVCVGPIETSPPGTPIFKTEFIFDSQGNEKATKSEPNTPSHTQDTARDDKSEGSLSSPSHERNKESKDRKDFIKRNIQLAGHAAESIAMTDEEKARVERLMENIDFLPDMNEDDTLKDSSSLALRSGTGYSMIEEDLSQMMQVDMQLQLLMPPEQFEAICGSSASRTSNSIVPTKYSDTRSYRGQTSVYAPSVDYSLHGSVGLPPAPDSVRTGALPYDSSEKNSRISSNEWDIEKLGEPALQEVREERELKKRLSLVDERINAIQNGDEIQSQMALLPETELKQLLSSCVRSLSRSSQDISSLTSDTSSERRSSVRTIDLQDEMDDEEKENDILTNPPKLPDDVLRQLLEDARRCGIGVYPSSLPLTGIQEEDETVEDTLKSWELESEEPSNHSSEEVTQSPLSLRHSLSENSKRAPTPPCETPIMISSKSAVSQNNRKSNVDEKLPDIHQFRYLTSPKP